METPNEPVITGLDIPDTIIDDMNFIIQKLNSLHKAMLSLQQTTIPVYSKYMKYKYLNMEDRFVYERYIYRKCDVINMVGNLVNAWNTETGQYEYISDNSWVVKLD